MLGTSQLAPLIVGNLPRGLDGMWTEVLAVILIVVANVICYAAHEKSLFHGHLRLPKIFFVSNRSPHCISHCHAVPESQKGTAM